MKTVILCLIYILFASFGQILFKLGTNKKFDFSFLNGNINIGLNINSIIGIVLYLVSFLLFTFILSKFDLTYILPILTGILCTFTFVLSIVVLGEKVNIIQIIGMVLIAVGIIFVNLINK